MKDKTFINYGTYINGNVYGGNFGNGNNNTTTSSTLVAVNDPAAIAKLLEAANEIRPKDPLAAEKAQELRDELQTGKPKVGKIQAIYDWLRRNCTVESTLTAIKFFGKILFHIIK